MTFYEVLHGLEFMTEPFNLSILYGTAAVIFLGMVAYGVIQVSNGKKDGYSLAIVSTLVFLIASYGAVLFYAYAYAFSG